MTTEPTPTPTRTIWSEQLADLRSLLDMAIHAERRARERIVLMRAALGPHLPAAFSDAAHDAISGWHALASLVDSLVSSGLVERMADLDRLVRDAAIRIDSLSDRLATATATIDRLKAERADLLSRLRDAEHDLQRADERELGGES